MNKKIIILTIMLLFMFFSVSSASARYCDTKDVSHSTRKALYDYYTNPSESSFTIEDLKSLLTFYISIGSDQITVDCTSQWDKISRGNALSDKIPECTDGTKYGKCSDTKPKYCYAGRLVPRCRRCGCPEGQQCDITHVYAEKGNRGRWGKCEPGEDIACVVDSECGTSEYIGDYYCKDGNVYRDYIKYTCTNPGEIDSACINETKAVLVGNCQAEEICIEGESECQTRSVVHETCESGGLSEDLTVSFKSTSGVTTTNKYAKYVSIVVEGIGQTSGVAYNDAFYVYTSYRDGSPITPKVQDPFLLYVDEKPVSSVTPTPSYNSQHSYSFDYDVGTMIPRTINFKIGDTYVVDNTGSFKIRIKNCKCTESDGGDNLDKKGTTSYYAMRANKLTLASDDDYCMREKFKLGLSHPSYNYVYEYWCNDINLPVGEAKECANGCKDSACVRDHTCSETDSGMDLYNAGSTTEHYSDEEITSSDECLDSTTLREYYCQPDIDHPSVVNKAYVDQPCNCQDAICVV